MTKLKIAALAVLLAFSTVTCPAPPSGPPGPCAAWSFWAAPLNQQFYQITISPTGAFSYAKIWRNGVYYGQTPYVVFYLPSGATWHIKAYTSYGCENDLGSVTL